MCSSPGAHARHPLVQGQGGTHGPLRSLLHGQRRAEKRYQAVAREFVHRAFVAVHLVNEQLIEFIHEGKQPFLTHLCAQGRVADQISKQHRHQLALAGQPPAIGQDFVGQVCREVALEVIELVVERGRVARRGGLPYGALRRVRTRCQALAAGAAEACPWPVAAVAGGTARF
jgi:hypothetical protein